MLARALNWIYTAGTDKSPSTGIEFLRFLPVSAVTSVIDFGLLILLTEVFHLHYLFSASVSFVAGQAWTYVACVTWVFARTSAKSHVRGFSAFLSLSTVGLVATVFLLWLLTEEGGMYYLYAKIICSIFLSLLLFFARKRLLFL